MESTGISFSGLASGIDTRSIIDALLSVEEIPLLRLQARKQELSQQRSIITDLRSRLSSLQDKILEINTTAELASYEATSSDTDTLTVTASGSATPGTHTVRLTQLAEAGSDQSLTQADPSTDVGTGTFDITVDSVAYEVDLSASATNGLTDVAAGINASDAPVTATVVDDGGGNYYLVITADETGTDADFTVGNFSDAGLNTNLGLSSLNTALDANLTFNGLAISRQSNVISDLIPGVTLSFHGVQSGDENVTITADHEGMREKVDEFVEAYNEVVTLINSQFEVNEDGETDAPLFGDSTLRSVLSQLRGAALYEISSLSGASYSSLSAIGISSSSGGSLSIDSTEFDDAVDTDINAVIDVFVAASDGIAARIDTLVDNLNSSTDGTIDLRLDGIDSRNRLLDRRIEAMERRLESFEESLVQRFASFETLISSYQTQGQTLTGFFGS